MRQITKEQVEKQLAKLKLRQAKGSKKVTATQKVDRASMALKKAEEKVAKLKIKLAKLQEEAKKPTKPKVDFSIQIATLQKRLNKLNESKVESAMVDTKGNMFIKA